MPGEPEEQVKPQEEEQPEMEELSEEQKEQFQKEEETAKMQLLRLRADFDNFRKRTSSEKLHLSRYALEPVLPGILDVMDDMERALTSPEHGDDEWRRGVDMMFKKLQSELERNGVKTIDSVGACFDPNLHEAITAHPSKDVDHETVQDEVLKGYMLHDKVIRHSKVVVATPEETNCNDQEDIGDE